MRGLNLPGRICFCFGGEETVRRLFHLFTIFTFGLFSFLLLFLFFLLNFLFYLLLCLLQFPDQAHAQDKVVPLYSQVTEKSGHKTAAARRARAQRLRPGETLVEMKGADKKLRSGARLKVVLDGKKYVLDPKRLVSTFENNGATSRTTLNGDLLQAANGKIAGDIAFRIDRTRGKQSYSATIALDKRGVFSLTPLRGKSNTRFVLKEIRSNSAAVLSDMRMVAFDKSISDKVQLLTGGNSPSSLIATQGSMIDALGGALLFSIDTGMAVAKFPRGRIITPGDDLVRLHPIHLGRFAGTTPNDPEYRDSWALNNTGQTVESIVGLANVDVDAPEAWDYTKGSSNVIVAVIDSGADFQHKDLSSNLFHNSREIPNNGRDDDGNAFVDDDRGWDFSICDSWNSTAGECRSGSERATDNNPSDEAGHGTLINGLIGANGNNGQGIPGLNWNISLLQVKVGSKNYYLSEAEFVNAVLYVVNLKQRQNLNIKVINASLGFDMACSEPIKRALYDAQNAGILVVASAGNSGSILKTFTHFSPAECDGETFLGQRLDNVISVAAVDNQGAILRRGEYRSNYGASTVHLAAPGWSLRSTAQGGGTAKIGGTSAAASYVSGVAALLLARDSTLSIGRVKEILIQSSKRPSSCTGIPSVCTGTIAGIRGGGIVSAYNALRMLVGGPTPTSTPTIVPPTPTYTPTRVPPTPTPTPTRVDTPPAPPTVTPTRTPPPGSTPTPTPTAIRYSAWTNPSNIRDVNNDGQINSVDTQILMDRLNDNLGGVLPAPDANYHPLPYYDVSGDGSLSGLDALLVINYVNANSTITPTVTPTPTGTPTQIPGPTSAWTNPKNRLDVNYDGKVTSLDTYIAFDKLNFGENTLTGDPAPPWSDVNGDGVLSGSDALQIINYLNLNPPPATPTAAVPSSFRVRLVDTRTDATISYGYGTNNKGDVVGSYGTSAGVNTSKPFYYIEGMSLGTPTDYGGIKNYWDGTSTNVAGAFYTVNDLGMMAGGMIFPDGGGVLNQPRSVLGMQGSAGKLRILSGLGFPMTIMDRNMNGAIVGYDPTNAISSVSVQSSSIKYLPVSGTQSKAFALNDSGVIVGLRVVTGAVPQVVKAVRWANESTAAADLGTFGGSNSYALDVNNQGQVVGAAQDANSTYKSFIWSNSVMTNLGSLPALAHSVARSVNNQGWVVGYATARTPVTIGPRGAPNAFQDDDNRAFIYIPGIGMRDLNSMISPAINFTIIDATDISDTGYISATARIGGTLRAVRLKAN